MYVVWSETVFKIKYLLTRQTVKKRSTPSDKYTSEPFQGSEISAWTVRALCRQKKKKFYCASFY